MSEGMKTHAESEKLIVWQRAVGTSWEEVGRLDVLPGMRAVDLVGLIRGVASNGDLIQYQGFWFKLRGQGLKVLTPKGLTALGVTPGSRGGDRPLRGDDVTDE